MSRSLPVECRLELEEAESSLVTWSMFCCGLGCGLVESGVADIDGDGGRKTDPWDGRLWRRLMMCSKDQKGCSVRVGEQRACIREGRSKSQGSREWRHARLCINERIEDRTGVRHAAADIEMRPGGPVQ